MLQNVTVLGDRVFKEVIKFKKFFQFGSDQFSSVVSLGPNSIWIVFL